jgi:putative protein-disulfide isomerase
MATTIYYVHDPMCSWCYGFAPALAGLLAGLPPHIRYRRLLGGLAPDCAEPMGEDMRTRLQDTWRRIEGSIPGIQFNFDFWTRCTPRRSTYPACRAVIAARVQDPALDQAMTSAIQHAYYREARNPSDRDTLIALAGEIGADSDMFAATLDAPGTVAALAAEMAIARDLGATGYPSLVLDCAGSRWPIPVDYADPKAMLATIEQVC